MFFAVSCMCGFLYLIEMSFYVCTYIQVSCGIILIRFEKFAALSLEIYRGFLLSVGGKVLESDRGKLCFTFTFA